VKWGAERWSCLVEALGFGGFVGWYIWKLQAEAPWTWSVMLVWLVVSFFVRGDRPKTIGWAGDNLWRATKRAAWFFVASSLLICVAGLFLGVEFTSDEPSVAGVWETCSGGSAGSGDLCGIALAESGASSVDICGRRGNGMVFCERAKYIAVGPGAGCFGSFGVVGVSDGMASFDARGAGVWGVSIGKVGWWWQE